MTHRQILKCIKKYVASDIADIIEDFIMDFQCVECKGCYWDDLVEIVIEPTCGPVAGNDWDIRGDIFDGGAPLPPPSPPNAKMGAVRTLKYCRYCRHKVILC